MGSENKRALCSTVNRHTQIYCLSLFHREQAYASSIWRSHTYAALQDRRRQKHFKQPTALHATPVKLCGDDQMRVFLLTLVSNTKDAQGKQKGVNILPQIKLVNISQGDVSIVEVKVWKSLLTKCLSTASTQLLPCLNVLQVQQQPAQLYTLIKAKWALAVIPESFLVSVRFRWERFPLGSEICGLLALCLSRHLNVYSIIPCMLCFRHFFLTQWLKKMCPKLNTVIYGS